MSEPATIWAPWHPWVSTDLDEISRRVKHLNAADGTNNRNGWRAVKVTLERVTE